AVHATQIRARLERAFAGERVHYELALPGRHHPRRPDRFFDVIYEPQCGGAGVESVVMAITDITERKATEQSLREQAHLLELAHDAILLLEMDGRIVAWNHGATETYGYTAEESVGRIVRELLRTEFPQPLAEIYQIAERQGRWEGELVHTTKDGRRIVVASRWAVQPATDGRPARVMETNRDITHRKRIEAELRAKEAELGLITTTTPVILTRCNRDLRFLFANDAAAALHGLTPAQMIGQRIDDLLGEEAFSRVRAGIERALSGETVDFEVEIPYPKAGLRWMRANYMPERNAEGEVVGWIASATDITERRRVEEKLRDSERTERLLAEIGALAAKIGVPEGLQVDDVVQSICEHVAAEMRVSRSGFGHVDLGAGHVTVDAEARDALPALKGVYPVSEYAPHLLADGVAGRITSMEDIATDPRTAERYESLYRPIGVRASINVPLHREGRWVAHFWVSSEESRRWTESEIDRMKRAAERIWLVVEQARVAMNLRNSEVRLARELAAAQQLQEVSLQLIQNADRDVQLRKILGAAAAITGTDKGNIQLVDALTGELKIIVHQGLSERFIEHFANHGWESGCEAARGSRQRVIVEDLANDPSVRTGPDLDVLRAEEVRAFHCTPIVGRDGLVLGMLNNHFRAAYRPPESELRYLDLLARMAADLIERKQVEAALREADRRKDEFLATLAHELRNPLAPIRNAVHLLRPETAQDPSGRMAHDIIDRQLQHLVRLVDDLMEVSRITSGRIELRKQRVDLGSILASAVETVHDLIETSEHKLTVSLPPDPVTIEADPVRMTQVFANLLNNASKYTPPGGAIVVSVRSEGERVAVSIKDSGAGIPPPMLSKVFNLFTQVDRSLERSTGGLGIGLHLVKRLIEMHGGTVGAHSEGENRGSEFVVRLPAPGPALLPEAAAPPVEVRRRAHPTSRRRILLVDDNHDSVESLAMLLEHEGHETEVAYDGQQAVDKAQTWRPEVILLDIGLPVMNGYDACRAIRRMGNGSEFRIIALSGWGQEQDRAMAREAGFDEHLVKPVNIGALMKLLDEPEPAQA
ncbi:MAG TPA: PAS domain S-box protein, partial [Candidatus Eisenbacteria bacterium]|nr:PAS domain S-box protein [Candidatus Eisenbacteria bacterium]